MSIDFVHDLTHYYVGASGLTFTIDIGFPTLQQVFELDFLKYTVVSSIMKQIQGPPTHNGFFHLAI